VLPEGEQVLAQAREIAAPLVGSRLHPLNKKQTDRLVALLVRLVTAE
jgi:hypothetical protein